MKVVDIFRNKDAAAWLLMVSAAAIHVLDETLTGFLPFYNHLILDLKDNIGFFPMPTFTFGIWLGGLIAAIIIGFAVTPIVFRGGRIIKIITPVLGLIMIFNAAAHIFGSIYFGRLLPGFWSSPFLLVTAILVVSRRFGRTGGTENHKKSRALSS